MHKPIKYVEKGLTIVAHGAWGVFNALNRINPGKPFTPAWSDLPLQKSKDKVKPPLGWPRETDSLCPVCVREARQEILAVLEKSERRRAASVLVDDLPLFAAVAAEPPRGPAAVPGPPPLEARLAAIRADELTPRQALELIYELKALLDQGPR